MARSLSDILRRFRPAAAPGPAGPAGVPADRVAETEAELAVVFVEIQPAVAEAGRIREDARAEAERRRREGVQESEAVLAEARARLAAVRADAASARLAELDVERATLARQAQAEVERVRRQVESGLPALVATIVEGVRATCAGPADTPIAADAAAPPASSASIGRQEMPG